MSVFFTSVSQGLEQFLAHREFSILLNEKENEQTDASMTIADSNERKAKSGRGNTFRFKKYLMKE